MDWSPIFLNDWEVDTRWAVNQRRPRRSTFISNLSYLVGSFNKLKEFINSLIVTNWTEVATIDGFNLKARDDVTQWWMQEINSRNTNSNQNSGPEIMESSSISSNCLTVAQQPISSLELITLINLLEVLPGLQHGRWRDERRIWGKKWTWPFLFQTHFIVKMYIWNIILNIW